MPVPAPGSAPDALDDSRALATPAARGWRSGQPQLGLAGLALVVPVTFLLAVGLGTPERSLVVLGPISTFTLPVIAMIAFWWNDWPGAPFRAPAPGVADTLLAAAGGVVLTIAGQALVAHVDLRGVFDPAAGARRAATFPATMAPAGAIFVAMLQLTLVCEGVPVRRLAPVPAGVVALAAACASGVVVYLAFVGPVRAREFGAVLTCVAVLQVLVYVVMRGWPFREIVRRPKRLAIANVAVIAGGWLAYLVLTGLLDVEPLTVSALAGSVVAAGLLVGMLFEGWLEDLLPQPRARAAQLASVTALAGALYVGLRALADAAQWTRALPEEWIAYAGLNAIGAAVLLHVAIGQRWPFAAGGDGPHERETTQRSPTCP